MANELEKNEVDVLYETEPYTEHPQLLICIAEKVVVRKFLPFLITH